MIRPPFVYGGENGHFTTFFKQAEEGKVVVQGDDGSHVVATSMYTTYH